MFKSNRGAVALMAYAAMLLFAFYGVLLCGNAARRYRVQTEAIEAIKGVYTGDVLGTDELMKIYFDNGGESIVLYNNPI